MITKGIRGATTVDENTEKAIKEAVLELMFEIIRKNKLTGKEVAFVQFTVTNDITAAYPARFVRESFKWSDVAFMCLPELEIENSLRMCVRVMVVVNCLENFIPKFVYLKGAENLRK